MSRRGVFLLWGGIAAGLLLTALFAYEASSRNAPAMPRPPELGGQQVSAKIYEIRFDRKYDLFCSFDREDSPIYRNCKILGFTGRGEESSGSGGFSLSSGSGSYSGRYFDHWLVLELADGRQAFLPPTAIKYIEEASPRAK